MKRWEAMNSYNTVFVSLDHECAGRCPVVFLAQVVDSAKKSTTVNCFNFRKQDL